MLGRNEGKLDIHSRVHDVEEALPISNSYVGSSNLTTTTAAHDDTTALFEEKNNKTGQVQPSNARPDKFPTNIYIYIGGEIIGWKCRSVLPSIHTPFFLIRHC